MYYTLAFLSGFWITFLVTVFKSPNVTTDFLIVLGLQSVAVGVIAIVVYAIIDATVEEK